MSTQLDLIQVFSKTAEKTFYPILDKTQNIFTEHNKKIQAALNQSKLSKEFQENIKDELDKISETFQKEKNQIIQKISNFLQTNQSTETSTKNTEVLLEIFGLIKQLLQSSRSKYEAVSKKLYEDTAMLIAMSGIDRAFFKEMDPLQKNLLEDARRATEEMSKILIQAQTSPSMEFQNFKPKKKVVLFDVDDTIFNEHFHNIITTNDKPLVQQNIKTFMSSDAYQNSSDREKTLNDYFASKQHINGTFNTLSKEEQRKKLEELINRYGIKNRNALKSTISKLIKANVKVGFSSFSEYPAIFIPTLEIMGFTEEEINHFKREGHIISYLPDDQTRGKIPHIKEALEKMNQIYAKEGWKAELSDVVLVDDSDQNISLAKREKILAIQAPKYAIKDDGSSFQRGQHLNYLKQLEMDVLGQSFLIDYERHMARKPQTTTSSESKEQKREQPKKPD